MTDLSTVDRRWLESAVRLARSRLGKTSPAPASAVLIVDEAHGVLLGRGTTGLMGRPSAEVAALADARGRAEGATAYLTLEPEPPEGPYESEVEKLVASGIIRVVVGTESPDRTKRGRGIASLRDRGVDVVLADHEASFRLIEGYASRVRRGRPFVTVILAVSADGMVERSDGDPVDLLSPVMQRWIASNRATCDAVLTSADWLERHGLPTPSEREGRAPATVVVATDGVVPPAIMDDEGILVVAGGTGDAGEDARILRVSERSGRLDLTAAIAMLGERGICTVQVEAGARLTEALVSAELVDRFELLESSVEIGRNGIPATPLGTLDARLRAAGFGQRKQRTIGDNVLRIFERAI